MSESKIVRLPGAAAGRTPRDPRIDAARGIALVMIIVTHMPGNPWEQLTIREWGFSDAAEAFFVMSGIAAGIAYSPAVIRWLEGESRLWDAFAPMWARAWTLYLVQILLTVTALGLFAWAADTFWEGRFRVMHNLGLIYSETSAALVGIPTLGYQIGYVNILPTYIVLMFAAPCVIAAAVKWPRATLIASVGLWFAGGLWRWNIPNYPGGGGWFFAPTSWQFIFLVGLMIGIRHRKGERLVPYHPALFWAAISFLVMVFAWRNMPQFGAFMNHKMAQLSGLGAPSVLVAHSKTYLALPRLAHILVLVYAVSCLPSLRTAASHAGASFLRVMGQQGLLVFALGTILMLAGQILMRVEPDSEWLPWVLPPAVTLICYLVALVRTRLRAPRRTDRPGVSKNSPMKTSASA